MDFFLGEQIAMIAQYQLSLLRGTSESLALADRSSEILYSFRFDNFPCGGCYSYKVRPQH